jgi:hypothetical protein
MVPDRTITTSTLLASQAFVKSSHEVHIASIPAATKHPVMSLNKTAARRVAVLGGRTAMPVLLIAEADVAFTTRR